MNNVYKCPKCKKYIFTYFCQKCQIDIRDFNEVPDFLKNIFFGGNND